MFLADGHDGPANGRSADDGRTADDGRRTADDGRTAADDDGRSAEHDGTTNAAITGATAANVQHAANAAAATDAAQRLWSTAQCFPLIMVSFLAGFITLESMLCVDPAHHVDVTWIIVQAQEFISEMIKTNSLY